MASRFSRLRQREFAVLIIAAIAAVPVAAWAQEPGGSPLRQQKKLPEAPSKLPKLGADHNRGLDFLFGALKVAPDQDSAKLVEARIWAL
ncbi:MAG: hypothetical protein ACRECG_12820, partial [Bradyrhizobium sp.]